MTTEHTSRFSALLKHYRRAAGLTQEDLAARAGISVRGLQDLERRVEQTPRRGTVELLAAALGLSEEGGAALLAAARHTPLDAATPRPLATAGPVPSTAASPDDPAPLIGRHDEVALLDGFLDGAGASPTPAAPVLLLAGEPGIGKTRLLQAAVGRAVAGGWRVLTGGCHRRGGQDPYAPLLDALARHIGAQRSDRARAELDGCAWLAHLLPELAEMLAPPPAPPLSPEHVRRLMYAAVARFLANVAGPAGTLLVLDDLQWAGPDALDLLSALVRGARAGAPLRVVGAYRDTEVGPGDPLGLLLADLARAGLVIHRALRPLSMEDAGSLLGGLLAGAPSAGRVADARALQLAGGVPLFLVSYAQALRAGGDEAAKAVPWDLTQGVRQRVALLPEAARQLLGAAAVVGRTVGYALLVAVTGQPEEVVLEGLEAACRGRLLLEDGEDAYAFAHDVIREVVEADLGAARRATLHRRVAEALEADPVGAFPELLAYHYARSGTPDKAVPYLELAGDHAATQQAHGAAERHYREALGRLEAVGRAREAARVREKLGGVLCRVGRYDAAVALLERAADAYRADGDREGLARATALIGWAHSRRGVPREGIARITALLAAPEENDGASPPRATLHEALGQLLFAAGEYDAALATCERVAELARAAGDDPVRVRADGQRVNLLQMLGRLGDALRVGQEVLPLAEATGAPDDTLRLHRDLAYIHALRGAADASRRSIDSALAAAERTGDPAQLSLTLAIRGWIALLGGDWRDARANLDRALALSRQVDGPMFPAYPLLFLARLSLAEGDRASASAAAREAVVLAEQSADLQALRWASAAMAELDILEGYPGEASARLAPLLDRPDLEECDVTLLLPVLAWAHLEQGQLDRAAELVERALGRARREGMRLVLADALRVGAMVALRQERWDEAERAVEEGVALARDMPYPYAAARLLHVDGRRRAMAGEPAPARERLEAALAIFRRLGARWDAARVEQNLAALVEPVDRGASRGAQDMGARSAASA